MSAENFLVSLSTTLSFEGGYSNNPVDPGRATNLGVTLETLSRWLGRVATVEEIKDLTKVSVAPIYKKFFWEPCGCDSLASGVDLAVFDYAVNSGPGAAIRALALTDGISPVARIQKICSLRISMLERLAIYATFGRGWNRRVAGILERATQLSKLGSAAS